jgi:hypothetical protein
VPLTRLHCAPISPLTGAEAPVRCNSRNGDLVDTAQCSCPQNYQLVQLDEPGSTTVPPRIVSPS